MTRIEFIDKIKNGSDIVFRLSGKNFTILTWCDDGIVISQWGEEEMNVYQSPEELADKFMVNGVPIGEITKGIEIIEYT